MPKRTDISSILIIGAGPIVIGQACEFDYSGTQAVKALKAAVSDAEKKDAQAEADKVEKNLAEAQSEFATVATGITPSEESDSKETKFDVGTELNELFGPMVQDLKKATAQPREIDHLREEVEHERKRLEEANTTVVGLKKL